MEQFNIKNSVFSSNEEIGKVISSLTFLRGTHPIFQEELFMSHGPIPP